jgi:hypothetical protein
MKLVPALCLTAATLAGCASQTSLAPVAAPAVVERPAPAEDTIARTGRWNVANARCSAILAASEDDRAAVGMFYYGYAAARLNFTEIDVARIEPNLRQVFDTCAANPNMTIAAAFRTLGRTRAR